jgi:hypothetical protein
MSTTAVKLPAERNVTKLLESLEIPFPPDQVLWRVTNTSNDKKRGQVVPYADQRAYNDRLNADPHSAGVDTRLPNRDHEQHHPDEEALLLLF